MTIICGCFIGYFYKLAQRDVDARRTKKNNTTFYGYKNHVKADTKTKLIEENIVTDASVHDSQAKEQLLIHGIGMPKSKNHHVIMY